MRLHVTKNRAQWLLTVLVIIVVTASLLSITYASWYFEILIGGSFSVLVAGLVFTLIATRDEKPKVGSFLKSFLKEMWLPLILMFLSLGIFIASVSPDLQSDSKSNTVYISYSEGFPSGTCCGSSLVYNMTDDTLLLSIPNYKPPIPWNQTLPPLFAYFYIGLPFQITNATCTSGEGLSSQCDKIFVSRPFKLQNIWWVATNQTWMVPSLYLKLSVSNGVTTDLWGEKSLKFSLGNMIGFNGFSYQNQSYIAKNVFHSSSDAYTLLRGSGRDAYRNPFPFSSIFITQFYFGVIPSGQTKDISPLPITVLGSGEVIWTVTGTQQDPFYGQDKLYALSTKNPSRDIFTAFSGIAFGSFLSIILEYHRKKRAKIRTTNTSAPQPEFL